MRVPCTRSKTAKRRCPLEKRPSRKKTTLAKRARTLNRKVPLAKGNKRSIFRCDSHMRVVNKGITVPNRQLKKGRIKRPFLFSKSFHLYGLSSSAGVSADHCPAFAAG